MKEKETFIQNCHICQFRQKTIFCDLHKSEVEYLNHQKNHQSFRASEFIFQEGGNPYGVFCVQKGKIKIVKMGANGKEQILRLAHSGDVIGYKSMLNNEQYQTSAIALEDTETCFVSKDTFYELIKRNQQLSIKIMQVLVNDLHQADNSRVSLAQKSLRERVAESLIVLIKTYGYEEDHQTIDLIISRIELANLVGTATESVIRFLSEFQKDTVIGLENKKIKILNYPKLQKIANIQD